MDVLGGDVAETLGDESLAGGEKRPLGLLHPTGAIRVRVSGKKSIGRLSILIRRVLPIGGAYSR